MTYDILHIITGEAGYGTEDTEDRYDQDDVRTGRGRLPGKCICESGADPGFDRGRGAPKLPTVRSSFVRVKHGVQGPP